MRNFNAKEYEVLIENEAPRELLEFMNSEINFINDVIEENKSHLYDLGAGHGRLVPILSSKSLSYTGVEINPEMFSELKRRCQEFKNATAVMGDMNHLDKLCDFKSNSLFVLAQNTVGTLEGAFENIIKQVSNIVKSSEGKLILSLFNVEAMNDFGRKKLFPHIKQMIGEVDYNNSDLESGNLTTKSGYKSKWWSEVEQNEIVSLLDLSVKKKISNRIFTIYLLD